MGEDRRKKHKQSFIPQNRALILEGNFAFTKLLTDTTFADVFFDFPNSVSLPAHSFVLNTRCPKLGLMAEKLRAKATKGIFKSKKEHVVVHMNMTGDDTCSSEAMQVCDDHDSNNV